MVLLYHYEASYRYRSLDASESVTTAHCPQLIYEVSFGQTVLSFVVITSPITHKKKILGYVLKLLNLTSRYVITETSNSSKYALKE